MKPEPKRTQRPKFWTTFADTSGSTYSFARIGSGMLLLATVAWGSWIVYCKQQIPDFTSVSLLFGAIYGLNRAGEVTSGWLGTKKSDPTTGK